MITALILFGVIVILVLLVLALVLGADGDYPPYDGDNWPVD